MNIDVRTARLIAVGASVAANCQPCLEINRGEALQAGATAEQVADAIQVGRLVRRGAASKLDAFAAALTRPASAPTAAREAICGCDLQAQLSYEENGHG